jgi:hypothetical protein
MPTCALDGFFEKLVEQGAVMDDRLAQLLGRRVVVGVGTCDRMRRAGVRVSVNSRTESDDAREPILTVEGASRLHGP